MKIFFDYWFLLLDIHVARITCDLHKSVPRRASAGVLFSSKMKI